MDRLGLLKTLITALDAGSLNRAAQRMGVTQSAVSQQIRQLEHSLGHQLLLRTATGVHATRAGATAAQHARQLLMAYEALEKDLDAQLDRLSGTYRISVGTILGRTVFGPLLLKMSQKYPDLHIAMGADDRYVDVVREGYDLAIRAGNMGNSEGYGRKIAQLDTVLVATPAYLNAQGRPQTIADLNRLKFIRYDMENTSTQIRVKTNGLWRDTPVHVGFTASDPQVIMQALETGVGFARTVRFLVEEQLADGRLEQVLPAVELEQKDIYAVYPTSGGLDRCQQAIIDGFLQEIAKCSSNAPTLAKRLELITA